MRHAKHAVAACCAALLPALLIAPIGVGRAIALDMTPIPAAEPDDYCPKDCPTVEARCYKECRSKGEGSQEWMQCVKPCLGECAACRPRPAPKPKRSG